MECCINKCSTYENGDFMNELACVVWLVSAVINFGSEFAYRQKEFPEFSVTQINFDRIQSFFMSLGGPMITIILLASGEFLQHGWRVR